jgi:hypothetical protein
MHLFGFLAQYWWAIVLAIALFLLVFVMIAGRGAAGGFRGRTSKGWAKWKKASDRVANVQARVLLTIFYFTLMAPFGLWQAFISDRLRLKRPSGDSYGVDRSTLDRDLADARRQY